MKFAFIAKHRGVWPADWLCGALGVSRGGFYGWLTRPRSQRSRSDEELGAKVRASFLASDRTYGPRRVWRDLLAGGVSCGLHRIERLMRLQALKARPRRRRLPPDLGERQVAAVAPNVLDRTFDPSAPNRKWIADFTYVWTAEGWLYVAAVIDLFSRRVVGWSMSAAMTAQLVTDALVRSGDEASPMRCCITPIAAARERIRSRRACLRCWRGPNGATIATVVGSTGWQPHTVRGFFAAVVRKKLGLRLESEKTDGERVYRIVAGKNSADAAGVPSA